MKNNTLDLYLGIGKNLVEEGIFDRFPELIPCIGENYDRADRKHKKLLFIGESNYFPAYPESVSVFQDAEEWYHGKTNKLIPEEKIIAVSNDTGYGPFVRVFMIANNLLSQRGIPPFDSRLGECGFYNYFLRPALNPGNSKYKKFIPKEIDREVAGVALCGIIERIKPELIVFLSKFAYNEFINYIKKHDIAINNLHIDHVVHPSSPWWNRWNGLYGKDALNNILIKYWLE